MARSILLFVLVLVIFSGAAQQSQVPSAEFDVIITVNGDIIYGRVMEVDMEKVRYKRTDIPDGPLYVILRENVYAISYRNQLKEIITPLEATTFLESTAQKSSLEAEEDVVEPAPVRSRIDYIREGSFLPGIGIFRSYSRVADVDNYRSDSWAPAFFLTYNFPYKEDMTLGVTVGIASFRYEDSDFSEYDQILTNRKVTESLLQLAAIVKYYLSTSSFRPYALGGLAINSSNVNSDAKIFFMETERTLNVAGGGRSLGLGVLLRGGMEFSISDKFGMYTDIGTGFTLLQIGGVINLR